MTTSSQKSSSVTQGGVALLETLIAILVFSLGVLGVIGLQAAMIKHTGDARHVDGSIQPRFLCGNRYRHLGTTARRHA
jgi:type IV pilus assembly protein PilV